MMGRGGGLFAVAPADVIGGAITVQKENHESAGLIAFDYLKKARGFWCGLGPKGNECRCYVSIPSIFALCGFKIEQAGIVVRIEGPVMDPWAGLFGPAQPVAPFAVLAGAHDLGIRIKRKLGH